MLKKECIYDIISIINLYIITLYQLYLLLKWAWWPNLHYPQFALRCQIALMGWFVDLFQLICPATWQFAATSRVTMKSVSHTMRSNSSPLPLPPSLSLHLADNSRLPKGAQSITMPNSMWVACEPISMGFNQRSLTQFNCAAERMKRTKLNDESPEAVHRIHWAKNVCNASAKCSGKYILKLLQYILNLEVEVC